MISHRKLETVLNHLLEPHAIKDYCPNGLQVEGRERIRKVVTGVTASQALIDAAVAADADAILVHHGYFWSGEPAQITGMKQRRIKTLLTHDINLFAYHLPLDVHPEVGNNAQLAKLLDIKVRRGLEPWNSKSVAMVGKLEEPMSGSDFAKLIAERLGREPLHCGDSGPELIRLGGPGAPAAVRATSIWRRSRASMPLSPAKPSSKPSTRPARWACTSMPPATTPPSVTASRRWGSGWRRCTGWM